MLLELLDDLLLVGDGEGGGAEDLSELGIPLEDSAELLERLCGVVESGGLGGSGVLFVAELLAQFSQVIALLGSQPLRPIFIPTSSAQDQLRL